MCLLLAGNGFAAFFEGGAPRIRATRAALQTMGATRHAGWLSQAVSERDDRSALAALEKRWRAEHGACERPFGACCA